MASGMRKSGRNSEGICVVLKQLRDDCKLAVRLANLIVS